MSINKTEMHLILFILMIKWASVQTLMLKLILKTYQKRTIFIVTKSQTIVLAFPTLPCNFSLFSIHFTHILELHYQSQTNHSNILLI